MNPAPVAFVLNRVAAVRPGRRTKSRQRRPALGRQRSAGIVAVDPHRTPALQCADVEVDVRRPHVRQPWSARNGEANRAAPWRPGQYRQCQLHALSRKSLNHFLPFHWAVPAFAGMTVKSACSPSPPDACPRLRTGCALSLLPMAPSLSVRWSWSPRFPEVSRGLVGDLRRPRPHIVRPRCRYSTS